MKNKKTQFKPNYAVTPLEMLADYCLHSIFGTLVDIFEKEGITEYNVYLITSMFPQTPRKFWLNLQKNYDETIKRLAKEGK